MSALEFCDTVVATFAPKRTDDLKPGAAEFIGQRCVWQAAWPIEEGPYAGQWAMTWYGDSPRPPFAWTPLCDLTDIERTDEPSHTRAQA